MQPPFAIQSIIENQLNSALRALPKWLNGSCHFALRKYFCGSYLLSPYSNTLNTILTNNGVSSAELQYLVSIGMLSQEFLDLDIVVPSYPHYDICSEYSSACGEFIALSRQAALFPHCNHTALSGVRDFPLGNQTIQRLQFSLGGQGIVLNIDSPPNHMVGASDNRYQVSCPEGWVVPDGYDKRTTWIPGSGCALSCNLPILTIAEWGEMYTLITVSPWLGLLVLTILIVTWRKMKEKRKQYLVILFALYSSIGPISFCLASALPANVAFCATNAVGYDYTDSVNFCTTQAIALLFSALSTSFCWTALAVDLYLKVVLHFRHTDDFKYLLIGLPFTISAGLSIFATKNKFGYYGALPFCFALPDGDLYLLYYPMFAAGAIGIYCMAAVIYTIARSVFVIRQCRATSGFQTDRSTDSARLRVNVQRAVAMGVLKKLQIIRTPLFFLATYLFVLLGFQIGRWDSYIHNARRTASVEEFFACVFQVYDGTNSWKKVCGAHPRNRANIHSSGYALFCGCGQSIVFGSVYLMNAGVWKYWYRELGISRIYTQTRECLLQLVTCKKNDIQPVTSRYHLGIGRGWTDTDGLNIGPRLRNPNPRPPREFWIDFGI